MKTIIILIFIATAASIVKGVIKSRRAWEDEHFFLVALTNTVGGNNTCGAVVVAHNWILTSASCAQNPKGMGAIAGALFTSSLYSDRWQKREIDFGITHQGYVPGEYHHDIALLHVTQSFEWTEWVRPPKMPAAGAVTGKSEVRFYGYGQVSVGFSDSWTDEVRRMIVNTLDWNTCRNEIPQKLVVDQSMVCTEQEKRQSFCPGDYGGPLVIQAEANNPILIGIASWSYTPCGFKDYPNVYTQVSLYLDWMNDVMQRY